MISYYELLGMIRDRINPAKVIYDEIFYCWDGKNYKDENTNCFLIGFIDEIDMFKKNIEIIKDTKKIKKLKIENGKVVGKWNNGSGYCYTLSAPQTVIVNKINEIIEVLNEKEKIQDNKK